MEVLAPLQLSHVCQSWRSIALSTPGLWTYASLSLSPTSITSGMELMRLWLSRAKARALLLDVEFTDGPDSDPPPHGDIIMHIGREPLNVQRWVPGTTVFHFVCGLIRFAHSHRPNSSPFKTESHLRTQLTECGGTVLEEKYYWAAREEGLGASPSPIEIHAVRRAPIAFGIEVQLPLGPAVTLLDLAKTKISFQLTSGECAAILTACPALASCALHVSLSEAPLPFDALHLPLLQRLSLSSADGVNIGNLLDILVTPVLTRLELLGGVPDEGAPADGSWTHLSRFVRRCSPPLVQLDIQRMDCLVIGLVACLRSCPSLNQLWLEDCTLDDSVLSGLSSDVTDSSLLPELRILGLVSTHTFNMQCVLGMLKMRHARGTFLQELFIIDCGNTPYDTSPATEDVLTELDMVMMTVMGSVLIYQPS
ncbi:hypothetical protein BD410DRAFT_844634 [Rickenella mellea]|uniref:F-box domain-containing protein n=1 Tax=Rickenella mellea TaxID=50990 RepID=A0A4Y7PMC0_9AGAM|nr:hypothetical protein BD410DRAFT_844634 [Rickenella mellea]